MSMSMPSLADRHFKTVLRGWDPKEVHEHLLDLELRLAATLGGGGAAPDVEAVRRADAILAAARAEADAILGAARREADDLGASRTAMDVWFGPDEPADVTSPDRWGALGDHVARLLSQAETEASAIVAAADARAGSANAEADAILEGAVSRARAHVTEVLARAETQLDATRTEVARLRGQLADVQEQVSRSLQVVAADTELLPARSFVELDPAPPYELPAFDASAYEPPSPSAPDPGAGFLPPPPFEAQPDLTPFGS